MFFADQLALVIALILSIQLMVSFDIDLHPELIPPVPTGE
jgi:hypothetical protein